MANPRSLFIRMKTEDGEDQSFVLDTDKMTVGRSAEATFSTPDLGVSRLHLTIWAKGEKLFIEDHGSSNGTFVNGEKVEPKKSIQITENDSIQIGTWKNLFKFQSVERHLFLKKEDLKGMTADQRLEWEQIQEIGRREAEKIQKAALTMSENLREEAKKKGESFIEQAQLEARRITDTAKHEGDRYIQAAQQKDREIRSEAQTTADKMIAEAKHMIATAASVGERQGAEALDQARRKADKMLQDAHQEIQNQTLKSKQQIEELKLQNSNEIQESARRHQIELKEKLQQATLEAKQLLQQAQHEGREILSKAQQEAREIISKSEQQQRDLIQKTQKDYDETLAKAREKSDQLLSQSQKEIQLAKSFAEAKAKELVLNAESQIQEMRSTTMREIQEMKVDAQQAQEDAHNQLGIAKADAQRKAEEILDAARNEAQNLRLKTETESSNQRREAQNIYQDAESKARQLTLETEQRTFELKEKSTKEAQLLRTEADQLRKEAEEELLAAQSKVQAKVNEAWADAQRGIEDHKKELERKANEARELAIEEGRIQARELIRQAKKEVELHEESKRLLQKDIQSLKESALFETSEFEKTKSNHRQQLQTIENEIQKYVEQQHLEERKVKDLEAQYLQFQENLRKAVDERDQTIQSTKATLEKHEQALQNTTELEVRAKEAQIQWQKATAEFDKVKGDTATARAALTEELNKLRDRAGIQIAEMKKEAETEASKIKMSAVDEAKKIREEENRQIKIRQKHYIAEISRQLDLLLVPTLKELSKGNEIPTTQAALKIKDVVDAVVTEESFKATGLMDQVAKFDSGKMDEKKKKKIRWAMAVGIPSILAVINFFYPQFWQRTVFVLTGTSGDSDTAANHYAKKLQDEKLARTFKPQQNEEYKDTYLKNVLYTAGYAENKLNDANQEKWARDLMEFLHDELKVDEDSVVKLVAVESTLIEQLNNMMKDVDSKYLDVELEKARKVEDDVLTTMNQILKDEEKYEKFREFSKQYYLREYQGRMPANSK